MSLDIPESESDIIIREYRFRKSDVSGVLRGRGRDDLAPFELA